MASRVSRRAFLTLAATATALGLGGLFAGLVARPDRAGAGVSLAQNGSGLISSRLELALRHSTLTNDRQQRADGEFAMLRDRDRDRGGIDATLHHDVTASPPNLDESVLL